jgi:hypothetical protein
MVAALLGKKSVLAPVKKLTIGKTNHPCDVDMRQYSCTLLIEG